MVTGGNKKFPPEFSHLYEDPMVEIHTGERGQSQILQGSMVRAWRYPAELARHLHQ
jgi:hypothetical protein